MADRDPADRVSYDGDDVILDFDDMPVGVPHPVRIEGEDLIAVRGEDGSLFFYAPDQTRG